MKNFYLFITLIINLCLANISIFANEALNNRPDYHAPIGVMRDHIHKKGEYMLSYRLESMQMKGIRKDDNKVSLDEVLNSYMMAPQKMKMKMYMIGAMYGLTDYLTISAMGSFIEKEMRMVNRGNQIINTEATDFGDTKINSMYQFFNNSNNRIQFNFGLSIPSGSIKHNFQGTYLPYPMQTGSGSYELLPGLSYSASQQSYSYGAQINGTFRLNENNIGYKLGDAYNLTAWTAKKLNSSLSISSRLNYTVTQKTRGRNKNLDITMTPANNSSFSGGQTLDFLLGSNFLFSKGFLEGNRLAIEAGAPIYQNVNGLQLETDYKIILGWQKIF
jgi:hypothetical protein